jgi:hypothetical protein
MKKTLDKQVVAREAALWEGLKKAVQGQPGKVCRK